MLLYEFEGKKLLKQAGINIPDSVLIDNPDQEITLSAPVILKAQVLSGKRKDAGGIVKVTEIKDLPAGKAGLGSKIKEMFAKTVNNEKVEKILVEQMIDFDKEYYISFSYSTESRGPVVTFSEVGGTGVEERGAQSHEIDLLKEVDVNAFLYLPNELKETAVKLWQLFTTQDLELLEVNPLVTAVIPAKVEDTQRGAGIYTNGSPIGSGMTKEGDDIEVYALDAKVVLDDDANFRRTEQFEERNLFGRKPTEAEIEARKIDQGDHRGTAGSVYWELDGDIGVIAAGGGGSVVSMDALIACGGKPANYTEHSGNPSKEKLKQLTKIVLSKPGLKGCWFVGGTANFTDIYETLTGFVEGLREVSPKPNYPIVVRRGGPKDKEAFEMLKEVGEKEGFDFHIYGRETPMTSTAKIMADLAYGKGEK